MAGRSTLNWRSLASGFVTVVGATAVIGVFLLRGIAAPSAAGGAPGAWSVLNSLARAARDPAVLVVLIIGTVTSMVVPYLAGYAKRALLTRWQMDALRRGDRLVALKYELIKYLCSIGLFIPGLVIVAGMVLWMVVAVQVGSAAALRAEYESAQGECTAVMPRDGGLDIRPPDQPRAQAAADRLRRILDGHRHDLGVDSWARGEATLGKVLVLLGRYADVDTVYQDLTANGVPSLYKTSAAWLLALAYIKQSDRERAIDVLIKGSDDARHDTAVLIEQILEIHRPTEACKLAEGYVARFGADPTLGSDLDHTAAFAEVLAMWVRSLNQQSPPADDAIEQTVAWARRLVQQVSLAALPPPHMRDRLDKVRSECATAMSDRAVRQGRWDTAAGELAAAADIQEPLVLARECYTLGATLIRTLRNLELAQAHLKDGASLRVTMARRLRICEALVNAGREEFRKDLESAQKDMMLAKGITRADGP